MKKNKIIYTNQHKNFCHMCKSKKMSLVIDLGHQPHSDDFVEKERLNSKQSMYPLRLVQCDDCGLLQIDYFVDPRILYQTNYVYDTSATKAGVEHYNLMADEVSKQFNFSKNAQAMDIGSNVGVLLGGFKRNGFKVLGVDPAPEIAKIANKNGIKTVVEFFGNAVAKKLKTKFGKFKIICATNCFAHLHDLDDAVKGIKLLLDKDGVLVVEAPYAVDMIEHLEYDTIYHQHIGYLSVKPMQNFFKKFGMEIFHVEKQNIHGGTIRYYVGHKGFRKFDPSVKEYLKLEDDFGLYKKARMTKFRDEVINQKLELMDMLLKLKKEGKKIVCVSTPAKGNTLLNYCHIDNFLIDFATENNKLKIGKYTPITHIPIFSDDKILQDKPDYALILAWNFAEPIMKKMEKFKEAGGKFIIPVPKPKIVK
jgi:SAM-dependent methyltransferase